MPALRRVITAQGIFTMASFWEWDRGPIGATTTDGGAIAFAGRAEGATTRTPATMQDGRRKVDTRHITAQRAITDRGITVGHRIMADPLITITGRRVTVADHTTTAGVAGLLTVAEGTGPAGMATDTDVSLSGTI